MSALSYKICPTQYEAFIAKVSKADPKWLLDDRRVITDEEVRQLFDWFAEKNCKSEPFEFESYLCEGKIVKIQLIDKPKTMANKKETRGVRNLNPTNLSHLAKGSWEGEMTDKSSPAYDKRFAVFYTMYYGLRAAFVNLRTYRTKHNWNTIALIISHWAPASENNTEAYIKTVCSRSGLTRNQKLTPHDYIEVVRAMCWVESQYVPNDIELRTAHGVVFENVK